MKIIGIDPGLDGGIARMTVTDGLPSDLVVLQIPTLESKAHGREVNWPFLMDQVELMILPADYIYIELVGAMPKQGASSGFKFGYVAGGQRLMFERDRIPLKMVSSTVWKPALGLNTKKARSIELASQIFPKCASQFYGPKGGALDGPAESALIAYYGWRDILGEGKKIAQEIRERKLIVMEPEIRL